MRYVALAAGYDGVLARDGRCEQHCIEAMHAVAASGRKLILVTGRRLRELLEVFPQARMFDYVVAENGAVMYRPASRESAILAQAPPENLLQELERRGVAPLCVGSSSVTTSSRWLDEIRSVLEKLTLDFQLVANNGGLSLLPPGVDKAHGVRAALREMGVSRHNLAVIGDDENDLALFALAGHAAAVDNAAPALKRAADRILGAGWCEGFLEFAHQLVGADLADSAPRDSIVVGRSDQLGPIAFTPGRDSVLICGPAGAGKAALCESLLRQLLTREYQCCAIGARRIAPCVGRSVMIAFGERDEAPRLGDVLNALERPGLSASVNLAALTPESRRAFTSALLLQLLALHDRVGRPHCVLIDEAQSFVSAEAAFHTERLTEVSMIYSTVHRELLPAQIAGRAKLIIALWDGSAAPAAADCGAVEAQTMTAGGLVRRISVLRPASCVAGAPLASADTATVSG